MMGERVGGEGPGDPKKRSWIRKAWDWFTGLFGSGVDKGYKSNTRLQVNNRLNVGIPTKMSEEDYQNTSWDKGGTHYQQVSQNTLLTSTIGGWHERGKYQFILPQNIGGWSQDDTASDGLIYKGCLSCHADNGAFTYAVKNSPTAGIGKSIGLLATFLLQTHLFTPAISGTTNETVIIGNGGEYVSAMNIVREVREKESIADLISFCQNRTLVTGVEHAVVKLGPNSIAPGEKVIVSGGPHGISFKINEVSVIYGHTHPYVTGPSMGDFKSLEILNQSRQYIFEGFNPKPMMIRKPLIQKP
ncbi:hypothetical protein [uncultured Chryseobacterium sp.]|uniref:hypothetical protein n=1 Tax=uncultured Chryseobacterium sp. TaxID=259322 RepID=UPI0025D86176|nr:hypothetical protein [uncultured Chryseobacterium sp.]